MNRKIKIVTGEIQSGKTTSLFSFANLHKSTDGILAPIVNDRRKLYHISSKTMKELEIYQQSKKTISVGKYFFLKDSFIWANQKLIESFLKSPNWLIIDEIGKLELLSEGLHAATKRILYERNKSETTIILVIRDYLLDKALKHYSISDEVYDILEL